jgi:hypothetical protein
MLAEVKDAFEVADKDSSGQCSIDELKLILKSTGFNLTPDELAVFIAQADADGSGEISLEEFIPLYEGVIKDLQMRGRLKALRRVASYHFFTTEQGASMLADFHHPQERVELFGILFNRIDDEENLDAMLGELQEKEKLVVDHQLGSLSLFNPMKPDGYYGHLDLSHHDSHLVAHCLIKLAVAEPGDNWLGETLDELKGHGPKEFDLNLNWVTNGPPRRGVLTVTYYTPPGCARYAVRLAIAKEVLGWEFGDDDSSAADADDAGET